MPDSFDYGLERIQCVAEKMIARFHPFEALRLGKALEKFLQFRLRSEFIVRAVHEVLRDVDLVYEIALRDASGKSGRNHALNARFL